MPALLATDDPRFTGARFGNVLHAVLEKAEFSAWAHWQAGHPAPDGQLDLVHSALCAEGYTQDELADGITLVTELTGHTLTVPLPEGGALHTLAPEDYRAEIEFHFAMQPVQASALLRLLHHYGVAAQRHSFAGRPRLEGLMTGKIDLTYQRAGCWYVLDYKTNRLPDYTRASVAQAMQHGQYDMQALIYTLALHRWLRFRLRDNYDYARDFGGVRYLFCRGLRHEGEGIFGHRFAPELVHALDALFAGQTGPLG